MFLNSQSKIKLDIEQITAHPTKVAAKKIRVGLVLVLSTLLMAGLLVVSAATQLHGVQKVYSAEQNVLVAKTQQAPRGLFYDRTGKKLVSNKLSYSIAIQPELVGDKPAAAKEISSALGLDMDDVLSALDGTQTAILGTKFSNTQVISNKELIDRYSLQVNSSITRTYSYPEEFAHILGYTGVASKEDIENGYSMTDRVGKYRLEKLFDSVVRGIPGRKVSTARGEDTVQPVPGNNVILTIDHRWQSVIYKELGKAIRKSGAAEGAAVVLDVNSGDVMAYVSYPSFNTNSLDAGVSLRSYNKLLKDKRTPLLDKVIGLRAAPGSSFKIWTAYALLEEKVVDATTKFLSNRCMKIGDRNFCEYDKRYIGEVDVSSSIARSSNIYFCKGALRLAHKIGTSRFTRLANLFKFNNDTGIDFNAGLGGNVPSVKYDGDVCNLSIGQGGVSLTPMHMAMMTAVLSNGGVYYKPNTVDRIEDQSGNIASDITPEVLGKIPISKNTQQIISDGMRKTVTMPGGTAYWHLRDVNGDFRVKTGTAEARGTVNGRRSSEPHGWVVGTFKNVGKKYAFAFHISHSGGSSKVLPVVRRFGVCLASNFSGNCL